jgi:hypothetical protein
VSGLDHVIPHYVELLRVVRRSLANEKFASRSAVQRKQKLQVEQFVSTMTEPERQRMNAIDRATLDRFFDGSLNIGIVVASIQTPNYFVDPVESPKVIDNGVTGMRNLFSAIRTISEENGAGVVVASMPYGAYLGGAAAENIRRLGFNVPDFLERDRSTEDQVSRATAGAGVSFISVLDGFQAVRNDDLFIPFDGHYSAAGTKLYADLLSKELMHLSPLLARTDNSEPAQN